MGAIFALNYQSFLLKTLISEQICTKSARNLFLVSEKLSQESCRDFYNNNNDYRTWNRHWEHGGTSFLGETYRKDYFLMISIIAPMTLPIAFSKSLSMVSSPSLGMQANTKVTS